MRCFLLCQNRRCFGLSVCACFFWLRRNLKTTMSFTNTCRHLRGLLFLQYNAVIHCKPVCYFISGSGWKPGHCRLRRCKLFTRLYRLCSQFSAVLVVPSNLVHTLRWEWFLTCFGAFLLPVPVLTSVYMFLVTKLAQCNCKHVVNKILSSQLVY